MNKFVRGLLFGLGFGIGIVIIALLTFLVLFNSPIKFGEPDSSIVGTNALIIQNHGISFEDSKPTISGTLVNSTDKTLSSVIVEASIFDDEDECFIDKEQEYFAAIKPQESVGYKIEFYDWDNSIDNENLNYKVRIKQGFDEN